MKAAARWTETEIAMLTEAYAPGRPANRVDLSGLAAKLGRHKTNVCRKARELGLTDQARPKKLPEERRLRVAKFATGEARRVHQSEIRKAWLAENPHPRGALGMTHSIETRALLGRQSVERWGALSEEEKDAQVFKAVKAKRDAGIQFAPPRGSWKAGWREVGDQRCFFRSRWEANYARYLEWLRVIGQIKSWEHEPHTFWFDGIKRGCVSYLPDFRVTNPSGSHEWHEVKGWMDARSKTTLDRMARYHPAEKLVVIREKQYNEIKRKVSSLIVGWEG